MRAVIAGASGYGGAELVGLLLHHPEVELAGLFGSPSRGADAIPFADEHPRFRGVTALEIQPLDVDAILAAAPDAVFLATPHEASHDLVPALRETGAVVLDLSGAYRLSDLGAYERWYGFAHAHAATLADAVYGLPELNRAAIATADVIAVPGCYPTAAVLPLAPFRRRDVIDQRIPVIVDATSGVSGAGRSPSARTHFCEVSQQPYGVFSHRHTPEIVEHAGVETIFTPHLGPYDRGILATIHVPLRAEVDRALVRAVLDDAYGAEPFVRLLPDGRWPSVGDVVGSNCCDIAVAVDESTAHAIVVSAIDNLLKGAAGQAVQCMNVRFGFPETTALRKETACLIS